MDTGESNLDSLAMLDKLRWSADPSNPGTVIGRVAPKAPPVPVVEVAR